MAFSTHYSGDLHFLNRIIGDRQEQYRNADWLRSPFKANAWECHFSEEHRLSVSFEVRLPDGELLTDHRHHDLLETFKCWLCIQTHFDSTGGRILNPKTAKDRVSRTLFVIDYILLNAQRFQLAEYGMSALTENDFRGILLALSSSSSISTSLYEWPTRLTEFLREKIQHLSKQEVEHLLRERPALERHIPPQEQRLLTLTDNEIILSRVWLWYNGYYIFSTRHGYRFTPSSDRIAALLYANTLRGGTSKKAPEELQIEPLERYRREFKSAPVRSNEVDQLSEQRLSVYCGDIRRLGLLAETRLPIPLNSLRTVTPMALRQALNLKTTGRFQTLPQKVVFSALRNAIEFALEYGKDLIQSYLSLAKRAASNKESCMAYANSNSIDELLTQKIKVLGVRNWTIDTPENNFIDNQARLPTTKYFARLRTNPGLWELLRVLFGAIQICVGVLMARRNGELRDLVAGLCLDSSETRLLFKNRKSGVIDLRETEARPIPKVAVKLIQQLEKLQDGLLDCGVLKKRTYLFCFPGQTTNTLISEPNQTRLSESIDFFCDYFETPLNKKGERYYIRQHQLRRFFAMLFFWGRSFGGMDTLRWFLGHTDVEHLYHYITESTPGEVLRSVKAHYGGELIKNDPHEATQLADLIEAHFGTREFSILDSEELDEYIEDLMIERRVEIEPEFFETPDGKTFRIAIRVTTMESQITNG